jgi:hypothetical protein
MFDKLGIGDVLDQATHQSSEMWGLNVAEALKAMVLTLRFIQGALQYNEMRNLCMMDNRRWSYNGKMRSVSPVYARGDSAA